MKSLLKLKWPARLFTLCIVLTVPVLITSILYPTLSMAKVEVIEFEDPEKQALYQQMIQELRCLVCQNQNLADSNAELAIDLRRKTREMIEQGKSRKDIVSFMVERYGEFVLYRPAFSAANLVLWLSPVVLLLITLWIAVRVRNRGKNNIDSFTPEERLQVRGMLDRQNTLAETGTTQADKTAIRSHEKGSA